MLHQNKLCHLQHHSLRTPKKKNINLRHSASNNHSNTTDSYFSATVSTTDVQETARGYVTLRRDFRLLCAASFETSAPRERPNTTGVRYDGEGYTEGAVLSSTARPANETEMKGRIGRACCGSVYLHWYTEGL